MYTNDKLKEIAAFIAVKDKKVKTILNRNGRLKNKFSARVKMTCTNVQNCVFLSLNHCIITFSTLEVILLKGSLNGSLPLLSNIECPLL